MCLESIANRGWYKPVFPWDEVWEIIAATHYHMEQSYQIDWNHRDYNNHSASIPTILYPAKPLIPHSHFGFGFIYTLHKIFRGGITPCSRFITTWRVIKWCDCSSYQYNIRAGFFQLFFFLGRMTLINLELCNIIEVFLWVRALQNFEASNEMDYCWKCPIKNSESCY